MTATNAVTPRIGNVSAGTSVFAMAVLERPLSKAYPEIDIVTTPAGKPVAMVHCNNCTNEINAWAGVFEGFLLAMGLEADRNRIFTAMFRSALDGEPDGGGLALYNCLSGEPVLGLESGRPLLCRTPESALTFPNFMRTQLYSAPAALRVGFEILAGEQVRIERLTGYGGFFKTPEVGQRFMAAATDTPVSVMDTAGKAARGVWRFWRRIASGTRTVRRWRSSWSGKRSPRAAPSPFRRRIRKAFRRSWNGIAWGWNWSGKRRGVCVKNRPILSTGTPYRKAVRATTRCPDCFIFSRERILRGIGQGFGLIIGDVLYAQQFHDLKERLSVMPERHGPVMGIPLLN